MHRSGTSALAGALSLLGCATPASLIRGDANNAKGYFESNAIGRLSDSFLEAMGSAWSDWEPLQPERLEPDQYRTFRDRARQTLLDDFAAAPLFVLKEPRMCRMVPFWLQALQASGCRVCPVHTHRNPQEVAASLARRDGFDPAFSFLLWLRHVLDAEKATRGQTRVFTSYRQLMQDWSAECRKLEDRFDIGLSPAASGVDDFLSDQLRHFSDTSADTLANPELPDNLRETFGIMERWADHGEAEEDHAALDRIRDELDRMSVEFGPLIRPGQLAMLALAGVETDLAGTRAELARVTALNKGLQTRLSEKAALAQKLQEDIGERERTLEAQARAMDKFRADVAGKEAAILKLRAEAEERERALQAHVRSLEQLHADNARLCQDVARAEGDFQALLQSSSWRLTAPLRHMSAFLRRDPKSL